jgi:hypothetical protein
METRSKSSVLVMKLPVHPICLLSAKGSDIQQVVCYEEPFQTSGVGRVGVVDRVAILKENTQTGCFTFHNRILGVGLFLFVLVLCVKSAGYFPLLNGTWQRLEVHVNTEINTGEAYVI